MSQSPQTPSESPSDRPSAGALPRVVTIAASRQSWRELPVRVWSLVTLGVLVVVIVVAFNSTSQELKDRELLAGGVVVEATIDRINTGKAAVDRSVPLIVNLSFVMPGETEVRKVEQVTLPSAPNARPISNGDKLPIRVDPKNIRRLTDRVQPTSWLITLAAPLVLAPLALLLAGITALSRRRMLRLFETGTLRSATVVESHRSALVPGNKVLKLTLVGGDGGVLSATYPDALGSPARGESLDVIVDAPQRHALVAKAYLGAPTAA